MEEVEVQSDKERKLELLGLSSARKGSKRRLKTDSTFKKPRTIFKPLLVYKDRDLEKEFLARYYGPTFTRWKVVAFFGIVINALFMPVDYLGRDSFRSFWYIIYCEGLRYCGIIGSVVLVIPLFFKGVQKRPFVAEVIAFFLVMFFQLTVIIASIFSIPRLEFTLANKGLLLAVYASIQLFRVRYVLTVVVSIISIVVYFVFFPIFYWEEYSLLCLLQMAFFGEIVVFALISTFVTEKKHRDVFLKGKRRQLYSTILEKENERRIELLGNILPKIFLSEVINRERGDRLYYMHDSLTLVLSDLVDFTEFAKLPEFRTRERLIYVINELFSQFDDVARFYNLELIKTVGDAYYCGDLNGAGCSNCVSFGITLLSKLEELNRMYNWNFKMRIGIAYGESVIGYVGKLFQLDVFGKCVEEVHFCEKNSAPNRILVSKQVKEETSTEFVFSKLENSSESESYFVEESKGGNSPTPSNTLKQPHFLTISPFETAESVCSDTDSTMSSLSNSVDDFEEMTQLKFSREFHLKKFPLVYSGEIGRKQNKRFYRFYHPKHRATVLLSTVFNYFLYSLFVAGTYFYYRLAPIIVFDSNHPSGVWMSSAPTLIWSVLIMIMGVIGLVNFVPYFYRNFYIHYVVTGIQMTIVLMFMFCSLSFFFLRNEVLEKVLGLAKLEGSVPIFSLFSVFAFPTVPFVIKFSVALVCSVIYLACYTSIFLFYMEDGFRHSSFEVDIYLVIAGLFALESSSSFLLHLAERKNYMRVRETELGIKKVKKATKRNEKVVSSSIPSFVFKKKQLSHFDSFDTGSVLFCDFGFGETCSITSKQEISLANEVFAIIDEVVKKTAVFKIKTIYRTYLAMHQNSFIKILKCAFAIRSQISNTFENKEDERRFVKIRIGVNTGEFFGGICGSARTVYDIFGDPVNICHRMMTTCEHGRIQTSISKRKFNGLASGSAVIVEERTVDIKGVGEMNTLYIENKSRGN